MSTQHAFDYLDEPHAPQGVCVVFGDEPFLKRLAMQQVRRELIDDEDSPYATFEGKTAEWRDVVDELFTVSMFSSGPRLAIVENADEFVTKQRTQLEDLVAKPKISGVLVLDVTKWAVNTRLYKAVDKSWLQIECKAPEKGGRSKGLDQTRLAKWLVGWCKSQHDAVLQRESANELIELVGPELGLLDQELAKLALFAGPGGKISIQMIHDVVGGWRTKTTWDLIDAAADGDAAEAIHQLDRLLQSGEHPNALFGQISWSLRRFAAATRIYQQAKRDRTSISLRQALEQAGFRRFPADALQNAERQLKQLGSQRTVQFYRWLLDIDLSLKGSHSPPQRARIALEMLFFRMARLPSSPT